MKVKYWDRSFTILRLGDLFCEFLDLRTYSGRGSFTVFECVSFKCCVSSVISSHLRILSLVVAPHSALQILEFERIFAKPNDGQIHDALEFRTFIPPYASLIENDFCRPLVPDVKSDASICLSDGHNDVRSPSIDAFFSNSNAIFNFNLLSLCD